MLDMTNVRFLDTKPTTPQEGDCYYDAELDATCVFKDNAWVFPFGVGNPPAVPLTPEQEAALQAEQDEFDDQYDKFSELGEKHNFNHSTWSMYEITNMQEIPFPEAKKVKYRDWETDKPIYVDLPQNATWMDLWKAADTAMALSGDDHHIFIEAFIPLKKDKTVLELHCGS